MPALLVLTILAMLYSLAKSLRVRRAGEDLLRAVLKGDADGVDDAIARRAPCDYRDEHGMTALML